MTLLALRGVSRAFGGIRAVDGVDLDVESGTIVGLIGPNGAGKTTLLNLISGLDRPSSGHLLFDEHPIERLSAHRIAALGVARTYQSVRLFGGLTVLENVVVGQHVRRPETLLARLVGLPSAAREARQARERAAALLVDVGLVGQEQVPARTLAYGDQRRLEIARALASQPRLLLLDEPAAGMPFAETGRLMDLIRGLPGRGVSVLLVEHNMHLVMNVCDRVAVLDFGRKIADADPATISADPHVIEAYLGVEEEVELA
jgi:ABC-type branched-subunit amino acid transport system ATPase component